MQKGHIIIDTTSEQHYNRKANNIKHLQMLSNTLLTAKRL